MSAELLNMTLAESHSLKCLNRNKQTQDKDSAHVKDVSSEETFTQEFTLAPDQHRNDSLWETLTPKWSTFAGSRLKYKLVQKGSWETSAHNQTYQLTNFFVQIYIDIYIYI